MVPAGVQAQAASQPQAWPARPIRLVVPQTPGGASDALARIIGQQLADAWGQQVLVDNRAGAGGNIGNELVAKANPDGYTWLLGFVGTHAINPSLYKGLSWDPQKSFTPLATLASCRRCWRRLRQRWRLRPRAASSRSRRPMPNGSAS
jgi:tripartite-type tricarboxylate transporter receptor subunit TctC